MALESPIITKQLLSLSLKCSPWIMLVHSNCHIYKIPQFIDIKLKYKSVFLHMVSMFNHGSPLEYHNISINRKVEKG